MIELTQRDLESALYKMRLYKRKVGWISKVEGEIYFFDSEPTFGGAMITEQDLENCLTKN